jgi:uncharacterized protein DUF5686/carboxypeptidase-like protein
MKFFVSIALVFICNECFAQNHLLGFVADSLTKKALPFATVRTGNKQNAVLTGIDGHYNITLRSGVDHIIVSYVGYASKSIPVDLLKNNDTIFLMQSPSTLKEVTVLPQNEKIRRILNTAIRNKPLHNPELYDHYQCYIYYKMYADILPSASIQYDSIAKVNAPSLPGLGSSMNKMPKPDSNSIRNFLLNNHLIFSETYSKRSYRKPMQLQEDVIASRFSGLKKTYFTFLVTDVLPFHVYGDYITLNGVDYINPVARGWQQRYQFHLVDEISSGSDTIFILTFRAKKNTSFNSLKGSVYINSDGYAISNFISSTGDSTDDREARIEQKYTQVDGRWFPEELNYDLVLKKYPNPQMGIRLNGHSVINNVSFHNDDMRFNKARPVTLGDSVDLHTEKEWELLRPDSLDQKEINTYRVVDSLSAKVKLESKVSAVGKITVGKLGISFFDIDISRLLVYNQFEGTRLGVGLSTNDKISKYYSVGAWAGYGFKDYQWKYGASATLYPVGDKDNWLNFSYQDNYQSAGDVHIHTDIDKEGFRNWLLKEVDRKKEYAVTLHTQRGYWEIELDGKSQNLQSLYDNNFEIAGKNLAAFHVKEAGIGIKYAYGERRIPMFGYYLPYTTKYPIVYFRMDAGNINADNYSANYIRSLAAVTWTKHFNRWGNDKFQLEAAAINTFSKQPLSRSFLLAGKGFSNDVFNYYAWGGFLTMRPYDYFNDRYISFFYRHDFDKFLWQLKFSKPFISLAHNMIFGGLTTENINANAGIAAPVNGYQESGILLNQLLALNYVHLANIYFNTGVFYHWASSNSWQKNALWVAGVSVGF